MWGWSDSVLHKDAHAHTQTLTHPYTPTHPHMRIHIEHVTFPPSLHAGADARNFGFFGLLSDAGGAQGGQFTYGWRSSAPESSWCALCHRSCSCCSQETPALFVHRVFTVHGHTFFSVDLILCARCRLILVLRGPPVSLPPGSLPDHSHLQVRRSLTARRASHRVTLCSPRVRRRRHRCCNRFPREQHAAGVSSRHGR